jgi:hypothetical protein
LKGSIGCAVAEPGQHPEEGSEATKLIFIS